MNITMKDDNVCRISVFDEYGGNVSGGGGGAVIFIADASPYTSKYGGDTWAASTLRAKCQEIKSLFPDAIQNAMKPMMITTGSVTTTDYVWVPSVDDRYTMGSNAAQTSPRMTSKAGSTNYIGWWCRDGGKNMINTSGSLTTSATDYAAGVRFMFAI